MEQPIVGTRLGSLVNLGLVIDATDSDKVSAQCQVVAVVL
uniref:Uncharacterized protein n=1 Tax=Peronospora matthiolae TaxID=2874970 RepID=A0AAV1TJ95_9STRA